MGHYAVAWFCVSSLSSLSVVLLQEVNNCEQHQHGSTVYPSSVSTAFYERVFVHVEFKPTPCAKDLKDPTWKNCLDHWRHLGTYFAGFRFQSFFRSFSVQELFERVPITSRLFLGALRCILRLQANPVPSQV